MKFWVGVTDNSWFDYLAKQQLEEVNFWQPSAKPLFKNTADRFGMPFFFKLKKPNHHVAGGGFFVKNITLPLAMAWEFFGEMNGAGSLSEFSDLLASHSGSGRLTQEIGCTILANAFFLPREQWLPDPPGWSNNIVRGKGYDSGDADGSLLWNGMSSRFSIFRPDPVTDDRYGSDVQESTPRFGDPVLVKPRLGQASFRALVTDAYDKRCAITGETTLVALEAAHIVPYAQKGEHSVRNGLLLRADFHRLFDVGLVSVSPEFKIKVSPRIRESWFNGKAYYRLNNQPLSVVPHRQVDQPDRDFLSWHLTNRFQE